MTRPSRTLCLPIRAGEVGYLKLPHPLASEEWSRLMNLLSVMEPGIVDDERLAWSALVSWITRCWVSR